MNPSGGRGIWLYILALWAFSPAGANAQTGAAGAVRPADQAITAALRSKMLQLITLAGRDRDIPAPISSALGLTPAGTAWPDHQFAFQWNGSGTVHAIAISRGADKDVVLTVRGPAAITVFRARPDGTLDRAVSYFLQTQQTMPLPLGEARAQFSDELAYWAANIDAVIAQN